VAGQKVPRNGDSAARKALASRPSAEARQALSSLAKGAPDADLTRDAKVALERLARRPITNPTGP